MRLIRVQFLSVFLAALVLPLAGAPAQNTVEGTVRYDGNSVPMTYVSARETRPSPTSDEPPQVAILIADRPAPAEIAGSRQAYYAAARENRIRGLLIVLMPPPDEARLEFFAPGGGYASLTMPDPFERVELVDLIREGRWVSGRLRSIEPGEFMFGGGGPDEPTTFEVDVRFRAAIAPVPQPSEVLTGEAARRSEQAAVALRALELFRTASPAEILALLHPLHPARSELQSEQAEAIIEAARASMPSTSTFLQSVERVVVYGDEAIVVSRDGDSRTSVSLRRDGGEWKMAAGSIPND